MTLSTGPAAESREWHDEIEGRPPFPLREEVELPSGKKLKGSRARIYDLLRTTALEGIRHRIGVRVGPPGWVPGYYLRKGWSGGNAGDRRVRDLRTLYGVKIDMRRFEETPENSNVYLYRWAGDPAESNAVSTLPRQTRARVLGDDSRGIGSRTRPAGPLSDDRASQGNVGVLRFWTSVGSPGPDAPRQVVNPFRAPGHPLAVPRTLWARRVNGLDLAEAIDDYVSELRSRWLEGSLRRLVESGGELLVWLAPEHAETMNVLPALTAALTRAGAEHLGEWTGRRVA